MAETTKKTETTTPAYVPAMLDPDRVDYRANPKVHLAEAGRVALSNWVGRIGNKRVRVYRGAQASKIPEAVQKAMAASEPPVTIGIITLADLGIRALPGQRGAQVLSVTPAAEV
jgi:hypothetical protein